MSRLVQAQSLYHRWLLQTDKRTITVVLLTNIDWSCLLFPSLQLMQLSDYRAMWGEDTLPPGCRILPNLSDLHTFSCRYIKCLFVFFHTMTSKYSLIHKWTCICKYKQLLLNISYWAADIFKFFLKWAPHPAEPCRYSACCIFNRIQNIRDPSNRDTSHPYQMWMCKSIGLPFSLFPCASIF